ncbi:hypothetical protein ACFSO7_16755 [Bacillus sp. CGMCC 1.16607]|uniref:hypothetical protein n=1 Tax=Bacillus sp. CGMCC 1.16607 TaxID=3351842 RepID=UPI003625616A
MKKTGTLLVSSLLLLGLTACSSDSGKSEDKGKEEKTEVVEKEKVDQNKELRSALLTYQGAVTKVIRGAEDGIAGGELDPTEVANTFSTDLTAVEIPDTLKEYASDLEKANQDLTQYYTKKAELLKAKSEDFTEADTLKQSYIDAVTGVFEKVELSAPAFKGLFQ